MLFELLKCHAIQVAYFVQEGVIRYDELSSLIRNTLKIGEFDPMLIPEAPGMPPEFPRLQIFTPDGYRLSASKIRIDFIIDLPLGVGAKELQEFKDNCFLLSDMLTGRGFVFSRVGVINTMFTKLEDAAKQILGELTKLDPELVSDASLSVTRKVTIGGLRCNSLFNVSNGGISTGDIGLVAMRDVNTDPLVTHALTGNALNDFITAALSAVESDSFKEFAGN